MLAAVQEIAGRLIIVSNETGLGSYDRCTVSPLPWWRRALHRDLARICDRVTLVAAGLPMTLKVSRDGGKLAGFRRGAGSVRHARSATPRPVTKPRGARPAGGGRDPARRNAGARTASVDQVHIAVPADHGVASEGISAYPRSRGKRPTSRVGAAIRVLARELRSTSMSWTSAPRTIPAIACVIAKRAGAGTFNLSRDAAMSASQQAIALDAGYGRWSARAAPSSLAA